MNHGISSTTFNELRDRYNAQSKRLTKCEEELNHIYRRLQWFPEVEDAKRKFNIPVIFDNAGDYAGHLREIAQSTSQHIAALEEFILVLQADTELAKRVNEIIDNLQLPLRRSEKAYEAGYAMIKQKEANKLADALSTYARETDLKMMTNHADSLFFAEVLNIIRHS